MLMGVYRPPFSRNIHTTLHRRLPWAYVSPSHERGHMKFYPNVRDRIDEIVSKTIAPDLTYNSSVRCFHLRDISDKSYLAYRRTTKDSSISEKLAENLFLQLVSFVWMNFKMWILIRFFFKNFVVINNIESFNREIFLKWESCFCIK